MKRFYFFLLLFPLLTGCGDYTDSPPAKISVSSDGRYVLSSHYGRFLILWDIKQQTSQLLSKKANIFSPYFIPDSHYFLWQDVNKKNVYVQSITGEIIKTFNPGFSVYGHVMTIDLNNYIAATDSWGLYQFRKRQWKVIKEDFHLYSGSALLFQLSLSKDYFLTTGKGAFSNDEYPLNAGLTSRDLNPEIPERSNRSLLNGVVLWSLSGKPIKKFPGNVSKTKATISPDNQYIVAGDENGFLFRWDTRYGRRLLMDRPSSKNSRCNTQECKDYRMSQAQKNTLVPDNFNSGRTYKGGTSVAVKFINEKGDYFNFPEGARYALLYNVRSPRIQKFVDLGVDPHPSTFSVFTSSNTIDSAPKAGILVMGQTRFERPNGNTTGIIVYQFNEKNKTLVRLWAPDGPPKHKRIINPDDKWEG